MTNGCFRFVGCACWVGDAPRGTRIDCWHTHTGLDKITDAGLKAFSAAVGSSTTITTVKLGGKYEWLVCWHEWSRVLVCMRVCSVGVVGVCWTCMTSGCFRFGGCACWVGGAPHGTRIDC